MRSTKRAGFDHSQFSGPCAVSETLLTACPFCSACRHAVFKYHHSTIQQPVVALSNPPLPSEYEAEGGSARGSGRTAGSRASHSSRGSSGAYDGFGDDRNASQRRGSRGSRGSRSSRAGSRRRDSDGGSFVSEPGGRQGGSNRGRGSFSDMEVPAGPPQLNLSAQVGRACSYRT